MIQAILELFTTTEKAAAMLESPIIELIFMILFILFIITIIVHFTLYIKIRNIRHYIKTTEKLDIEPFLSIKQQYNERQSNEAINLENFVQEKISSWHMFRIPIVNLIKLVQMTVSVFILLGVLGTFIGLTISLGSIQASGDQLVNHVSIVLSGIDVAFYTSIVGMGFSLIMTVLIRLFNVEYLLTDIMLHIESHLERQERHGIVEMIDVAEKIHQAIVHLQTTNEASLQSIVQAFGGFKDYTSELQQSAEDLAHFNEGLAKNLTEFQTLFQQMTEVTNGFASGTKQLNEQFETLFTYFKQSDVRNERLIKTFEHISDHTTKVQNAQIQSFTTFDTSVDELKNFTANILQEQYTIHDSFTNMAKEVQQSMAGLNEHEEKLLDLFGDDLHTKLTEWIREMEKTSHTFVQIEEQMTPLPKTLEIMNETHVENKQLLQDRFRELKIFNDSFHQHINEHANASVRLDNQIKEAINAFREMTNNNQQFIQEMNQSIDVLKQTFTKRDQQLDTNVTMVKETLMNYVQSLEGTLGQKLEQLIRQLDQQSYQTNDQMNRAWVEMRQVADDINQNNVRTNQQLLQDATREIQSMNRHLTSLSNNMQDNRIQGPFHHDQ